VRGAVELLGRGDDPREETELRTKVELLVAQVAHRYPLRRPPIELREGNARGPDRLHIDLIAHVAAAPRARAAPPLGRVPDVEVQLEREAVRLAPGAEREAELLVPPRLLVAAGAARVALPPGKL